MSTLDFNPPDVIRMIVFNFFKLGGETRLLQPQSEYKNHMVQIHFVHPMLLALRWPPATDVSEVSYAFDGDDLLPVYAAKCEHGRELFFAMASHYDSPREKDAARALARAYSTRNGTACYADFFELEAWRNGTCALRANVYEIPIVWKEIASLIGKDDFCKSGCERGN
jgi:hypothetical protein